MNSVLWVVQLLLAAAFLAHGWLFLSPPPDIAVQMNASLPRWFSLFLGVAEVLAAVGLTLPGLTRILPWLVVGGRWRHHDRDGVGDGLPSDARGVQLGGDHPGTVHDGHVPRLHAASCVADRRPARHLSIRERPGLQIECASGSALEVAS